jgi:hypothetical protein
MSNLDQTLFSFFLKKGLWTYKGRQTSRRSLSFSCEISEFLGHKFNDFLKVKKPKFGNNSLKYYKNCQPNFDTWFK